MHQHTSIFLFFFPSSSNPRHPQHFSPVWPAPHASVFLPPELRLTLTKGPGDNGASPTHSRPSSSDGSSDLEVDELETPSDSELLDSGHEFEWEGGKES